MTIKLEMLRAFAAVSRHGNLQDAANELGRTPSAVSMMLKQLEASLGASLFETDRKNKLSALGVFVKEQADAAVTHFANVVDQIEGHAKGRLGQVRIAMVPSVAGTILPRLLARKIDAYQHINLDLRDMDSGSVLRELRAERIDLGIATLTEPDDRLHAKLLVADHFGIVCAKEHPLAQRETQVGWEDLRGHRLFANGLSASIDHPLAKDLHRDTRVAAHTLSTILGMVRANTGVTLLPELAVRAYGRPDLTFLPLRDPTAIRHIQLLRRADRVLPPAVQMLEHDIVNEVRTLGFG